ncbi:putative retroelement [Abeliophyllum distichum]|uniref:Retroelement n=1 Tax=Abeliophyllum distichum TaxID=126358 RepID=A0ABD1PD25_9LAMI
MPSGTFGVRNIVSIMPQKNSGNELANQQSVYSDAIESERITFESKKKMAVDEDPFLQPISVNMVILNLDKLGLRRFKLVVYDDEDEPRPNVFEHLKGKTVVEEEKSLCARCQKEVGNTTERVGRI